MARAAAASFRRQPRTPAVGRLAESPAGLPRARRDPPASGPRPRSCIPLTGRRLPSREPPFPIAPTTRRADRVRILLSQTQVLLPVFRGLVGSLCGALVLVRAGCGRLIQSRGLVRLRVRLRTAGAGGVAGPRRGRRRGDPRRARDPAGGARGRKGRARRGERRRRHVLVLPVHGPCLRVLPRVLVPVLAAPMVAMVRVRIGRDHLRHLVSRCSST